MIVRYEKLNVISCLNTYTILGTNARIKFKSGEDNVNARLWFIVCHVC